MLNRREIGWATRSAHSLTLHETIWGEENVKRKSSNCTHCIGAQASCESLKAFFPNQINEPRERIWVVISLFGWSNQVACHAHQDYVWVSNWVYNIFMIIFAHLRDCQPLRPVLLQYKRPKAVGMPKALVIGVLSSPRTPPSVPKNKTSASSTRRSDQHTNFGTRNAIARCALLTMWKEALNLEVRSRSACDWEPS